MTNQTTCPTCGAAVRVVGKTTMHYEPVEDARVQALGEVVGCVRDMQDAVTSIAYAAPEIRHIHVARLDGALQDALKALEELDALDAQDDEP